MIIVQNYKQVNQLLPLKPTIIQTACKENSLKLFNIRNLLIQNEVWIITRKVNKKFKFPPIKLILHLIAIETKSSNKGYMPRTNPKPTHIEVSGKILS